MGVIECINGTCFVRLLYRIGWRSLYLFILVVAVVVAVVLCYSLHMFLLLNGNSDLVEELCKYLYCFCLSLNCIFTYSFLLHTQNTYIPFILYTRLYAPTLISCQPIRTVYVPYLWLPRCTSTAHKLLRRRAVRVKVGFWLRVCCCLCGNYESVFSCVLCWV